MLISSCSAETELTSGMEETENREERGETLCTMYGVGECEL